MCLSAVGVGVATCSVQYIRIPVIIGNLAYNCRVS